MEEGKLLYAIIDLPHGDCLRVPVSPCPRLTGLDDAPLEIVPYRDLAAVVSSIDLKRFGQACPVETRHVASVQREGEERLQADLVRYQQVNLFLLKHHTVVPMRFGFTARDREHVEEVLEKTYLQLRTFLNRLKGKVELVVQTFWDLPKVLREIAAQDEGILQAEPVLSQACPELGRRVEGGEAVSGQLSVEVGKRLFAAAEARKKELSTVIHTHLFSWAMDSSEGPCKGEAMIFNRSYLVEKEKEPLFDAAVDRLGAGYDGYLTFRYIGPLPAYSFVNIELNQGNFEVIDQARRTLGLLEKASLEEIKAAYRRLALTSHPDRHPGDPQAEERFKVITHAYEVLETYCHSSQTFPNLSGASVSSRRPTADSEQEDGRRPTADGGQRSAVSGHLPAVSGQRSESGLVPQEASLYCFAREEVERTFIVKER
jgi:hypothetical protein